MVFKDKLKLLMQVFKISNSRLAKGIKVDASLVSRWRSGERTLTATSPHIAELATFFVKTLAYPYQKAFLDRLLASLAPEAHLDDESTRIHCLADWLSSQLQTYPGILPDEYLGQTQPDRLIDHMNDWLTMPDSHMMPSVRDTAPEADMPAATRPLPAWSLLTVPGQPLETEVFWGLDGKRQAVINLLNLVVHASHPCTIDLVSEEPMNWLTGDPQFTRQWAELLHQAILQGHHISVIHIVSRQTREIASVMNYWLPLHLSGDVRSYYNPRYVEPCIKHSLFAIRGQAVILAQSTQDAGSQGVTFLYRDPKVITHYEQIYRSCLKRCQPLFSVFSLQHTASMMHEQSRLSDLPGRCIHFRHQPDTSFLPDGLLAGLTGNDQGNGHDAGQLAAAAGWISRNRSIMRKRLEAGYAQIDILPLSILDLISHGQFTVTSDCDMLLQQPFQLNRDQLAVWLEQIIDGLKTFEHYEMYFYQSMPMDPAPIDIRYHEHQAALFMTPAQDRIRVIELNEANSLYSLDQFLSHKMLAIPTCLKSRPEVLARLQQTLDKIRSSS